MKNEYKIYKKIIIDGKWPHYKWRPLNHHYYGNGAVIVLGKYA
jgi:hypothetical protein